jgi:hypothetical protein
MPPPQPALLPLMMAFVSVGLLSALRMPPPALLAVLLMRLTFVSVGLLLRL